MVLDVYAISRDRNLYNAKGVCDGKKITVLKGSKINRKFGNGYKPSELTKQLLADNTLVDENDILLRDLEFDSLSAAASFVAGRTSNGMITWKTNDGKYVRNSLNPSWEPKNKHH